MIEQGFPVHPLAALLPEVCTLAREAGERIMTIYRDGFSVTRKDDATPLTEADLAANALIGAGLRRITPGVPVLSEEDEAPPFDARRRWASLWLVDPLDGTRQFIQRNEEFTVNIALVHGHAPVLGVVYVPASGVCYYAARGLGAWRADANVGSGVVAEPGADARADPGAGPVGLRVRPYRGGRVRVLASRAHGSPSLQRYLARLGNYELVNVGSSLKSCLIAQGEADLYARFGPTGEWDTAAAQCLVEEAGGRVTDTQMRPLRYNARESLLNPHFFVFGETDVDWSRFLPESGS